MHLCPVQRKRLLELERKGTPRDVYSPSNKVTRLRRNPIHLCAVSAHGFKVSRRRTAFQPFDDSMQANHNVDLARFPVRRLQAGLPGGRMKKTIWTGVLTGIVGFATAAAITAQTAPAPAAPQSSAASADKRITVTGCLKEAPSSPAASTATAAAPTAGTTGTTGTTATAAPAPTGTTGEAAAAPKFMLTNAAPSAPAAPASATSTTETPTPTPTPAPAASASAAQTFQLIANAAALSPHVGKKMELTGTLEDQNPAAGNSESSAGSEAKTAVLRVESGKIIAASCSQ
jgi:hypothetical protein